MKKVWFVQDYDSMAVDEVFTTKKAAMEKAGEYGKCIIEPLTENCIEFREKPLTPDDTSEPICHVRCVPVRHNKRSGL